MNPFSNKQTMLKLALFAALAANVSYGPMKEIGSMELMAIATTTELTPEQQRSLDQERARADRAAAARSAGTTQQPAGTTAPPAGQAAQAPQGSAPAAQSAAPAAPAAQSAAPAAPAATTAAPAATAASPEVSMSAASDRILVCRGTNAQREQRVAYRYADGYSYVEPLESDCRDCYVRMQTQQDSTAVRSQLLTTLASEIEKLGCTQQAQAETEEDKRKRLEEERENEKKALRCELKREGPRKADGTYDYVEMEKGDEDRIECNKKRLANVDKELERELGKKPSKAQIQARIDQIMNKELKGEVKRLLTSKDEDEREEGRELAADLKEDIADLREEFELKGTDKWAKRLGDFEKSGGYVSDLYSYEERFDTNRDRAQELTVEIASAKAMGQRNFAAEVELENIRRSVGLDARYIDQTIYTPLVGMQAKLGDDWSSFMDPFNTFKTQFGATWTVDPKTGLVSLNANGSIPGGTGTTPQGINPFRSAQSVLYTSRGIAGLPMTAPQIDLGTGGSRFSTMAPLSLSSTNTPGIGRLNN